MEQVRTKRKVTKEEWKQIEKEMEEEKARRLAELDAPDLTDEEKEFLVELKMSLEDKSEGFSGEELLELFLGEDGLWM